MEGLDGLDFMENETSPQMFHLLPFSTREADKPFLFVLFLLIYLTGMLVNSFIILVILFDNHLHTPMYLFLCNLSLIDLCYTTSTSPKLLNMILTGNYTISFIQCFIQLGFYWAAGSIEDILLFAMACDRYVAICQPLHYHRVFNRNHCIQITAAIWILGCSNSIMTTITASKIHFCPSNIISQYLCDAKSIMKISCANTEVLLIEIYIEILLLAVCPFICILLSYVKIVCVILNIKSKEGRRKAFSTCSSHLTVLILFYGTSVSVYVMPLSLHYKVMEQVLTVLYTAVTPALNPLIYCLQNKDVKTAVLRFLGGKANKPPRQVRTHPIHGRGFPASPG
ncbi:olfactory receptor 1M1-like [Aquarana catesbeiana]|uniref:olfactory receptor 1M1-like n=1 Tax=Aquarana catesbeiana TaxID=8400 RepID=UPI003CC9EC73